jgi:hypothetical protein
MKKAKTDQRQRELNAIEALPDDQIDLSDIPELTDEQLRRCVRKQRSDHDNNRVSR